jgi:uncharacterized protein
MSTKPNHESRLLISAFAAVSALGAAGLPGVQAQDASLEHAMQVYESGDFGAAAHLLLPYAERGDALSQLRLATLYRTGNGVKEDEYEAAYWFARAAEQGVAEAQFHLGLMYLRGIGVTESGPCALEWISLAAGQGFGDAEDLYGYILENDEPLAC